MSHTMVVVEVAEVVEVKKWVSWLVLGEAGMEEIFGMECAKP